MKETLILTIGRYAIAFGTPNEFEYFEAGFFSAKIQLYKAKRIWKFLYKTK